MISSDCRPCDYTARIVRCEACGTVQKQTDRAWHEAVSDVYAAYVPYHQAQGAEQRVFDADGASKVRSERFLDYLLETTGAGDNGQLLDIGCGSGQLLQAMNRLRPQWRLAGHELGEAHRQAILGVPGADFFYFGPIADIPQRFDLITLVHVLEHVEDPIAFLEQAAGLLNPGGAIGIEVPNLSENPFDLVVFDHTTHYTRSTLQYALDRAGLDASVITSCIPKELSAVLRPDRDTPGQPPEPDQTMTPHELEQAARWLEIMRDEAIRAAKSAPLGIFGTAVGGTWLGHELGDLAQFFVDEDSSRAGREHMGKPVYLPKDVPAGSTLALPLVPEIDARVRTRLQTDYSHFHCLTNPELQPMDSIS